MASSLDSIRRLIVVVVVHRQRLDLTMMQVDMNAQISQPIQLAESLLASVRRERHRLDLGQRYVLIATQTSRQNITSSPLLKPEL